MTTPKPPPPSLISTDPQRYASEMQAYSRTLHNVVHVDTEEAQADTQPSIETDPQGYAEYLERAAALARGDASTQPRARVDRSDSKPRVEDQPEYAGILANALLSPQQKQDAINRLQARADRIARGDSADTTRVQRSDNGR